MKLLMGFVVFCVAAAMLALNLDFLYYKKVQFEYSLMVKTLFFIVLILMSFFVLTTVFIKSQACYRIIFILSFMFFGFSTIVGVSTAIMHNIDSIDALNTKAKLTAGKIYVDDKAVDRLEIELKKTNYAFAHLAVLGAEMRNQFTADNIFYSNVLSELEHFKGFENGISYQLYKNTYLPAVESIQNLILAENRRGLSLLNGYREYNSGTVVKTNEAKEKIEVPEIFHEDFVLKEGDDSIQAFKDCFLALEASFTPGYFYFNPFHTDEKSVDYIEKVYGNFFENLIFSLFAGFLLLLTASGVSAFSKSTNQKRMFATS